MSREELRGRLARRPNAVRFSEARQVLEAYGWSVDRVRGSHHVFVRGAETFVIPLRRPYILVVYVRQILSRTRDEGDEHGTQED